MRSSHEAREIIRMLDERTVEVSLPSRIGYERIAMECSASFAKILGLAQERIDCLLYTSPLSLIHI